MRLKKNGGYDLRDLATDFRKFTQRQGYEYYIVKGEISNIDESMIFMLDKSSLFVQNFLEISGIQIEDDITIKLVCMLSDRHEKISKINKNDLILAPIPYLSKENIQLYNKKKKPYDREFKEKLSRMNEMIEQIGILPSEVVITNGMAMEALGIRKSGDIDLIILPQKRFLWDTDERIELATDIEIKPLNSYRYSDEKIINFPGYHFTVLGFKFLSPALCVWHNLKLIKKKHNRRDLKLLLKYYINDYMEKKKYECED